MLTIIIAVCLIIGFIVGFRRGLLLQLMHFISMFASYIIAYMYYQPLAKKIYNYIPFMTVPDDVSKFIFHHIDLEKAYYNVVAFAIIFFASKIVIQVIVSLFDILSNLPILKHLNKFFGGIFGVIEVYILLFIALYILVMVPHEAIQNKIKQSTLATTIVTKTPILSSQALYWWTNNDVAPKDLYQDKTK